MKKMGVLDAKKLFYEILQEKIDYKSGLEKIKNIKTKNKVLKGYIFGVLSITNKKIKKYSFVLEKSDLTTILRLNNIVTSLGDNRFIGDFEKGYFLAWKDYINFFLKTRKEDK